MGLEYMAALVSNLNLYDAMFGTSEDECEFRWKREEPGFWKVGVALGIPLCECRTRMVFP